MPVCTCNVIPELKIINSRPVTAKKEEVVESDEEKDETEEGYEEVEDLEKLDEQRQKEEFRTDSPISGW